MSGTKAGALKAKNTIIDKYGVNYYKNIGSIGGKATGLKGFALNRDLARKAGAKGGKISKRGKAKQ